MDDNPGCELDLGWVNTIDVNSWAINKKSKNYSITHLTNGVTGNNAAWLLKAISCTDLTTLAGDDTGCNVARLCRKAAQPISKKILTKLGFSENEAFTTAAVCVYPARVKDAFCEIKSFDMIDRLSLASVATGFPSGQYDLSSRIDEIKFCVSNGASEIDVVVDRSLIIKEKWSLLYQELQQMKEACGSSHMKTILAVGELASYTNIYKASLVAMMAGSDFIKTSTGKEAVNATVPVGLVMSQAIRNYYEQTRYKVGFKAAGGIRTSNDAINWLNLVYEELGRDWLDKKLFRFGASGLLSDIEQEIFFYVHGYYPVPHFLTLS